MMNGMTLWIRNEAFDIDMAKRAFTQFLRYLSPKASERTIQTYCTDAFFILSQLPYSWVEYLIEGPVDEDEENIKQRLKTYIRNDITACRTHPDKDAQGYLRSFWKLVVFLRMTETLLRGKLSLPRRVGSDA